MLTEEIRDLCMSGTKAYYDFLAKNDRGLQRIAVRAIEAMPNGTVQITLGGKLMDTEAVFFYFRTNNKKYNTSQIPIAFYDANTKCIHVRPEEEFLPLFENIKARDLEIVSDLKFLVERVRVWFEKNGGKLLLPNKESALKGKEHQIEYFEDKQPSENQLKAISTIFNSNFSYVWGAPGTGKTQGVLSYALLHYLRNGYKVAILGPTNNAIEQVLRGVIEMTDRAAIDRDKIIRLGNPSRAFADEYPEVCEVRGMMKQLEGIEEQIKVFKSVLLHKQHAEILDALSLGDESWEDLRRIKKELDGLVQAERQHLVKLNATTNKVERRKKQLIKLKNEIRHEEKKLGPLDRRFKKLLGINIAKVEKEVARKKKEYRDIEDEIDELEAQAHFLKIDWDAALAKAEEQKEQLTKQTTFLKNYLQDKQATVLVDKLFSGSPEEVNEALQELQDAYEKSKKQLGDLAEKYQDTPVDLIEQQLQQLQLKEAFLKEHSTEERLKNVSITAATLDGYIGRFMEQQLNVDHIFVDEAGYANVVKVLTLFNHRVPITLLGDHMQLPPVCEINDSTIREDNDYHNAFVWAQSAIFAEGVFVKDQASMLQEYVKNQDLEPVCMQKADLNQTYRFGSNLAKVLDKYVYKNGFTSANSQGKTLIYGAYAPKPASAKKKRENEAEAKAIERMVSRLDTDDFVILTPYRNQLKLLAEYLPQAYRNQQIITVHGSQGREWHTVILSVVDTYDKWFTDSTNKMSKGLNLINTAVSRAKIRLIIVGDTKFWERQQKQLLCGLLEIAE
ncbi:MAG: hypothetical protein GY810_07795 [Aureispira sp.]|nr:hypothetical protein [Aureispira sp.]